MSALSFLYMILIGLVIGAVAKFIMPGKDPGGIIITILLGIGGAMVAGLLGRAIFGWYQTPGSAPGIFASVLGSILILFIYRLIIGRTAS